MQTHIATALARYEQSGAVVAAASLASWSEQATSYGGLNEYWDATDELGRLTPAQRDFLPSQLACAERDAAPAGANAKRAFEALLKIAARVHPGLSEDAGARWIAGMIESLSHYPEDLLRYGIDEAGRKQFTYLNEVGPFIAAQIDPAHGRRKIIATRLRLLANATPRSRPSPPGHDELDTIMAEYRAKVAKPDVPGSYAAIAKLPEAERHAAQAHARAIRIAAHEKYLQRNPDIAYVEQRDRCQYIEAERERTSLSPLDDEAKLRLFPLLFAWADA